MERRPTKMVSWADVISVAQLIGWLPGVQGDHREPAAATKAANHLDIGKRVASWILQKGYL